MAAAVRTSPPTVSKLSKHVHTPQLINAVIKTSQKHFPACLNCMEFCKFYWC